MAETIVTLSGDDAALYKAFQRIIDQQAKTEGGYDKLKAKSKETSDALVNDTKKLSKEEIAAARNREKFIKQIDADTKKRLDQMNAAHKAEAKSISDKNDTLSVGVGKIGAMAAAYVSVSGAIQTIVAINQQFIDQQDKSLETSKKLAAAQQEAAKNLAGSTPTQISETLTKAVPAIAKRAGFADLSAITKATGSVASILGDETKTASAVEASARVTRFTPEELQKTATATADLMRATGLQSGPEALAMLASTGSVARPEQLSKLATGAAVAANAGVSAAPGQSAIDASREAIAAYSQLSAVDPEGQSSATATAQLIAQVGEIFTDQKTIEARREKIAEYEAKSPERINELGGKFAEMQIAERKAAAFKGDQSPEGRIATYEAEKKRLDYESSRRELDKKTEEYSKLLKLDSAATGDPGTFNARLQRIQQSPELQREFADNLRGEEKFKPLFLQAIDPLSKFSEGLRNANETITTNPEAFNAVATSTVSTPQMALADFSAKVETQRNVATMQNTDGALRAQVAETVSGVLADTSIDWVTATGGMMATPGRSIARTTMPTGDFLQSQQTVISNRLGYLQNEKGLRDALGVGDGGTNLDAKIETLTTTLQALVNLSTLPSTLDELKRQGTDLNEYMAQQNQLLEQIKSRGQLNNAPAIRAQLQTTGAN